MLNSSPPEAQPKVDTNGVPVSHRTSTLTGLLFASDVAQKPFTEKKLRVLVAMRVLLPVRSVARLLAVRPLASGKWVRVPP
jgi:hypothetical protein